MKDIAGKVAQTAITLLYSYTLFRVSTMKQDLEVRWKNMFIYLLYFYPAQDRKIVFKMIIFLYT